MRLIGFAAHVFWPWQGGTDYGKKKVDITLGFGQVNGELKLDDNDPALISVFTLRRPSRLRSQKMEISKRAG